MATSLKNDRDYAPNLGYMARESYEALGNQRSISKGIGQKLNRGMNQHDNATVKKVKVNFLKDFCKKFKACKDILVTQSESISNMSE